MGFKVVGRVVAEGGVSSFGVVVGDVVADWGGPVKTDSALRYADLKVAFELVGRAVAQGGVAPVEVEVGVEVVGDL